MDIANPGTFVEIAPQGIVNFLSGQNGGAILFLLVLFLFALSLFAFHYHLSRFSIHPIRGLLGLFIYLAGALFLIISMGISLALF